MTQAAHGTAREAPTGDGAASLSAAIVAAFRDDSDSRSRDNYPVGGGMQVTRKVRKQISFYHLQRLETRPAPCSFLMKYKGLGPSYPGPGKLIYKHEIDFSRARWKRGLNCVFINVPGWARGPEVE